MTKEGEVRLEGIHLYGWLVGRSGAWMEEKAAEST